LTTSSVTPILPATTSGTCKYQRSNNKYTLYSFFWCRVWWFYNNFSHGHIAPTHGTGWKLDLFESVIEKVSSTVDAHACMTTWSDDNLRCLFITDDALFCQDGTDSNYVRSGDVRLLCVIDGDHFFTSILCFLFNCLLDGCIQCFFCWLLVECGCIQFLLLHPFHSRTGSIIWIQRFCDSF
jgi:hypothetical protein